MSAIIFRSFPFRSFPKKKTQGTGGILKINSRPFRSFPKYRERPGTTGNDRERAKLQGERL